VQQKYILVLSMVLALLLNCCGKKGPPMPKMLALPGAINDLSGEVKDGVLFLSFTLPQKNRDGTEMKDLAGFKVLKRCGTCMGEFQPFTDVRLDENKGYIVHNGKLYIYDDELTEGFQYSYKVYSYTQKGSRGEPSNMFTAKWERPPEPPGNVSVKAGDGIVEVTWPADARFTYNVYRREEELYPLFPINQRPLITSSFMDSGLENGRKYVYDVRKVAEREGVKREGEGYKVAATPRDTTPPAAPTDVAAEKMPDGVAVTWKENAEKDAAGYNVYRVGAGKAEKLNGELIKGRAFVDRNVPDYRYVSYYVTAVDSSGNESLSSREPIVMIKE
jgi:hypothetical protein